MNLFGPPAAPPGPPADGPRPAEPGLRTVRFVVAPSTFISLALILISLWLLVRLWPVILVVVVALFILGTLSPTVLWLEERRIRRGFGIAIVFTGVITLAVLAVAFTVPSMVAQGAALFEREPAFRAALANRLAHYHLSAPFADWLRNLSYGAPGNTVGATAFAYSLRIFQVAAYGLSALFLALYMMIDRDRLRGGLFALVPRSHHIRLTRVILNLETIVGAYIRGQLMSLPPSPTSCPTSAPFSRSHLRAWPPWATAPPPGPSSSWPCWPTRNSKAASSFQKSTATRCASPPRWCSSPSWPAER